MADVFIELQRNGNFLKCTAIDGSTGEEAVVIGPLRDPESLKRLAVQKLCNKLGLKPPTPKPGRYGGGGGPAGGTDITV